MELGGLGLDMRFCWEIDEKKKQPSTEFSDWEKKAFRANTTLHRGL
jgi:hypothetical protein